VCRPTWQGAEKRTSWSARRELEGSAQSTLAHSPSRTGRPASTASRGPVGPRERSAQIRTRQAAAAVARRLSAVLHRSPPPETVSGEGAASRLHELPAGRRELSRCDGSAEADEPEREGGVPVVAVGTGRGRSGRSTSLRHDHMWRRDRRRSASASADPKLTTSTASASRTPREVAVLPEEVRREAPAMSPVTGTCGSRAEGGGRKTRV